MTKKEILKEVEKAQKILDDSNVWGEVYDYGDDLPAIRVEIEWGDWKHAHLRAKWLLEQNGFRYINECVTDEDGSDCYSAVHTFIIK